MDFISSLLSFRTIFAGLPIAKVPSGITSFCTIKDHAPIIQFSPILEPFNNIEPIPIRVLSDTIQP